MSAQPTDPNADHRADHCTCTEHELCAVCRARREAIARHFGHATTRPVPGADNATR